MDNNERLSLKPAGKIRKKPAKMGHLHLKRFADSDDLTPGARRNRAKNPYEVIADVAPTGRAICKQCGKPISKASVRFVLMLQCHKGYRMSAPVHGHDPNCFMVHVETEKLTQREEFLVKENVLGKEKSLYVWNQIDALIARNLKVKSEQATIAAEMKSEQNVIASAASFEDAAKDEPRVLDQVPVE